MEVRDIMRALRTFIGKYLAAILALVAVSFATPSQAAKMIGYWEGWNNLTLGSVSTNYDIVILSFGTGGGTDSATITFSQSAESTSSLISDIATLHARGVKVLLSVGGGGGPHTVLANSTDLNNFVSSIEGIVSQYNLDGVDLDLEDGIFANDQGDNDIFNPTTPTIVNLITAMHQLRGHFGSNFMVTAPAESEAMNGYGYYGNQVGSGWTSAYGGFIPFLNGTRDILTFVAPQYYNAAPYYGLDNNQYTEGVPDFDVSQVELILNGYTLVTGQYFPPIAQSQIAMGVPATNFDVSYLSPATVLQAAEYIGSGTSYGGNYHLVNPNGYPGFQGVMDWDINGDQSTGYALADTLAPYLHSLPFTAASISDYYNDLSMISAHSANWQVSNGVGATVNDDPNVLTRTVDDTEYVEYQAAGMVSFNLRAYASASISDLTFFSSPDGSTWTAVPVTTGSKSTTTSTWGWYDIIPSASLPSGTNYLKIVVTGPTGSTSDPALSQIAVNYTGSGPTGLSAPPTPVSVAATPRNTAITVSWQPVTGSTGYNIYRGTSSGGEGSTPMSAASTNSFVDYGLTAGSTYYYKVAAVGPGGTSAISPETSAPYVVEAAYPSTAAAVPGVVDADNYDIGGSNIGYWAGGRTTSPTGLYRSDGVGVETCADTNGVGNGFDVGYSQAGFWQNYTVNSEAVGTYNVAVRVASSAGGTLQFRALNGLSIGPSISVPATGGNETWSTVNTTVTLMYGTQIIQLYDTTGGVNVEYLSFVDQTPSTPSGLTASAGQNSVSLFWLPSSTGAATYSVFRGTASGQENYTSPVGTGIGLKIANNGCVYTDTTATPGSTYYYTVKAVNSTGSSSASNEASVTLTKPGPYGGTPAAVPGTVQSENYDTGGQGSGYSVTSVNGSANSYRSDGVDLETTTDTGGGYDLGWTSTGQWFDYTVNVSTAGAYKVTFRLAADSAVGATAGSFHLQNAAGTNLTGSVSVPGTGGWETWTNVTATVTLPAGVQTLRFSQDTGGYNINYMAFALQEAPYGGTPAAIPGTVQAENYDVGGQGVGYSVTSTNGSANSYRSDGIDLETTTDTGGGYDLGWTTSGQWFRYTVNVVTAGSYTIGFRVAAPTAVSGAFNLTSTTGGNLTGSVSVPETGGWEDWTTVNITATLSAGVQTMTLNQTAAGWNINYMTFTLNAPPPAPTGLTATASNDEVSLAWKASIGATSYNVYRGTAAGEEASTPIKTGLTKTAYADKNVENGTTYSYKVASVDSGGTSALSSEVSATPVPPPATLIAFSPGAENVDDDSYTSASPVTFTLSTIDAAGPDNVKATYYSVNGGSRQSYIAPVSLASGGEYAISYWSVDQGGDVEMANQARIDVAR